MDLDLRRLRYFVAVADELSFTRAASMLHMTQPALSRQIRVLEDALGVPLFERDRRGTELTAAGAQLLEDARPMLASSNALEQRIRAVGRGETRFVIGFMPGVDSTAIVREFAATATHLTIDVVYTTVTDQVDYLLDGRVDVCFVRLPLPTQDFALVPLFPEPRVAALPSSHPLGAEETVSLDQLSDLPLLQDPGDVPEWRGPSATAPSPERTSARPPTIEESLERVAGGAGFFVLPAGLAAYYHHPHVRYADLPEVAPRMVALAYNADRAMPEIEQFAKIAVTLLLGESPEQPT